MSNGEQRGTSRSGFLKQAAGATMVVAGAGVGAGVVAQQAAAASSTSSNRFSLEIDGINVGAVASVSGGVLEYDVVDLAVNDHVQRKHLGQPKYEDFTVAIGSGMGKGMYDWIKASFDKGYVRKNGAVIAADFNFNEKARRTFTDALITEVTVPALDAASTAGGYFTVKFSAASVADVKPSGAPVHAAKQKLWLCSNFRFIVQGVDTTRVASIDSFTWKQSIQADGSAVLDAGDLGVSFPAVSLPSWQHWYNHNALSGVPTDERSGILELVGAQGGAVLDFGLLNLGLFHLDPNAGAGIRRVTAEMYLEERTLDFYSVID
jgi:phage tail-like protein